MVATGHMSHDLLSNRIAPNLSNRVNDIFAVIGYLILDQPMGINHIVTCSYISQILAIRYRI